MSKSTKSKYSAEFKDRAVKMAISSEKPTTQVAKELGVKAPSLYSWIAKAKTDEGGGGETQEHLFDEISRLKKELSMVKEQRDILKKATAYFAKESL